MEKYIVFIILAVGLYYLHNCWVENKIEKFLNSKKVTENFGDAVTVDGVDDNNAINTLAKIAVQLNSKDGLTVPGKLNFVNSKQIGLGIQMDDDNLLKIKNKDGGQMIAITDNGVTKANVLQLGDKFRLSGVGDKWGNDAWLRLMDKDNTNYYGGLAAGQLYSETHISAMGNANINGNSTIKGNLIVKDRNILDELDEIKRNYVKKNNDMYIKVGKRKDGTSLYTGHHVIVHGGENIAAWGTPVQATKFQIVDDAV
jgi:hypothetical protein